MKNLFLPSSALLIAYLDIISYYGLVLYEKFYFIQAGVQIGVLKTRVFDTFSLIA